MGFSKGGKAGYKPVMGAPPRGAAFGWSAGKSLFVGGALGVGAPDSPIVNRSARRMDAKAARAAARNRARRRK